MRGAWQKDKCPAASKKCSACEKSKHFPCMCKTKEKVSVAADTTESNSKQPSKSDNSKGNIDFQFATRIFSVGKYPPKRIMLSLTLNGKQVNMQLDTAANVTLVSENLVKSIPNVRITPSKVQIKDYSGNDIKVAGAMDANLCHEEKELMA